ncbi:hypothetical protein R3I94_017830 [Phoxinus phoxinus]
MFLFLFLLVMCLPLNGVTGVDTEVSVKEGDSVTLNTGVQTNQQDIIRWYYNVILIALITGDLSNICTDVQCNEVNGRFRDRLKLDHQTGSLTITHTRNTHSGEYTLQIISSSNSEKIFSLYVHGVSGVDTEVSVMEGDSVTLNTGVQTNQQDIIRWYFNDILIARISGDLSNICTDVQCDEDTERFRDRLKLDHQTGSLTITQTRNTHSGEYTLQIISSSDSEKIFSVYVHGVTGDIVSVKEGDSVTLNTGVQTNQQDIIRWYYNVILIALISGDLSNICTDVQCNEDNERFRDRLKLDHQTGSLTIMNTRNTDSGEYTLEIISSDSSNSEKIFSVSVHDGTGVDTEEVSVMEGDSVTLNTGVQTNQQDRIKWYYNVIRIALITGDLGYICTDVQCNEGNERFRDRLKLDHQTGSLTITHTRNTDSGEYTLQIISRGSSDSEKIFSVSVYGARLDLQRNPVTSPACALPEPLASSTDFALNSDDTATYDMSDQHNTDSNMLCDAFSGNAPTNAPPAPLQTPRLLLPLLLFFLRLLL